MADKPILFSAPMVRALLEGRKTQTRRVAKFIENDGDGWHIHSAGGGIGGVPEANVPIYGPDYVPYVVGDRLWVREAWQAAPEYDAVPPRDIPSGAPIVHLAEREQFRWASRYRHSQFMPRWASRLTLTVTDVRVERLQDISEADAEAEGMKCRPEAGDFPGEWDDKAGRRSFRSIWNSINGPGAWDENPWVAALTFTVRKGNIDQMEAAHD